MDQRAQQARQEAERMLASGNAAGAIALLARAVKRSPRDAWLQFTLGNAHDALGDWSPAIRAFQKAISLDPSQPAFHVNLGRLRQFEGRFDEAERCYDRALALDPEMAFAIGAKVELLQLVGRAEEARTVAEEGLERHPRDIRLAIAYAKLAPRIKRERRAADILQAILDDPDVNRDWEAYERRGFHNEAKIYVLFRLANLLDRLGEYDRAFDAARTANHMVRARYDAGAHAAVVDRMLDAWSPETIETLPRASRRTTQPILIVGVPRSGTSLVEQILACHPDVHAAGEVTSIVEICAQLRDPYDIHEPLLEDPAVLTRANLDMAQRRYQAALYNLGARAQPRVTDKMPGNFAHLGLVSRMLPGARVIHCKRDPLDTGVSCYFQQFTGANPWCYRLTWIGAYWNDYARIMDHWKSVLADDLPIFDVVYRDLVSDPQTWVPRLLDFAGLKWDDACLRFHESSRVTRTASNEQVRRPMYSSSVGRNRNYAEHLAPLREALGLEE